MEKHCGLSAMPSAPRRSRKGLDFEAQTQQKRKTQVGGIPCKSHGSDSVLLMQWVPSLVRELRFCMPHGAAKNKPKKLMFLFFF